MTTKDKYELVSADDKQWGFGMWFPTANGHPLTSQPLTRKRAQAFIKRLEIRDANRADLEAKQAHGARHFQSLMDWACAEGEKP